MILKVKESVSILGLARSPTSAITTLLCLTCVSILGLARSPTSFHRWRFSGFRRFNTWAREEPNKKRGLVRAVRIQFQYLGSRGAQRIRHHGNSIIDDVSILGLARSPTNPLRHTGIQFVVSILGLARSPTCPRPCRKYSQGVSILGLARSPTRWRCRMTISKSFQYLGSRGAQRLTCGPSALTQAVSILGLARSPT